MSKRILLAVLIAMFSSTVFCANHDRETGLVGAASSGFATGIAVVDDHLEQSIVLDVISGDRLVRQTRGIIGEANTDEFMLSYLNRNGKTVWHSMTPRTGPQGIDHVYVKYNRFGTPVDMYIAESKYGSSRLGVTADGRQMSSSWSKQRLEKLGRRYIDKLAHNDRVVCRMISADAPPNVEMSVMICKNGKLIERKFWRANSKSEWFYSGPANELDEARRAAGALGQIYVAGAKGQIAYRSTVCYWKMSGDDLELRIDKVNRDGSISKGTGSNGRKFVYKGAAGKKVPEKVIGEITKKLRKTKEFEGWSARELRQFVKKSVKTHNEAVEAEQWRTLKVGALTTAVAAVGASVFDAAIQFIYKGNVDWREIGATGLKTGAAVGVGEVAGYVAMKSGVRGLRYVRGIKASAVGAVFAAFDFYQAYKGNISYQDASVNSSVTGVSMGAGAAAGALMMAAPAYFGAAAGTGTAISSLSGAAATNATLAFYGGGTVASGGFGVAGGALVVGGAVAIVAIGVGAAAAYGYSYYKEKQQWSQSMEWGNWLKGHLMELPRFVTGGEMTGGY